MQHSNTRAKSEAHRIAASAAGKNGKTETVTEVQLLNGVVLAIKPVASFLMRRAQQAIPTPKPPTFRNNDRDEENPLDPEYLRLMDEYDEKLIEVSANVALLVGTSIKELPEDVSGPDSDEWLENVSFFNITPELKCSQHDPAQADCGGCKKARYLSWLTLYAVEGELKLAEVMTAVIQGTGINEQEVLEAMRSFRGRTQRRADLLASAKVAGNGHNVQEAASESST